MRFEGKNTENEGGLLTPFQVLGISESASDADVREVLRQEMSKYHPDKLATLELPQDVRNILEEHAKTVVLAATILLQPKKRDEYTRGKSYAWNSIQAALNNNNSAWERAQQVYKDTIQAKHAYEEAIRKQSTVEEQHERETAPISDSFIPDRRQQEALNAYQSGQQVEEFSLRSKRRGADIDEVV